MCEWYELTCHVEENVIAPIKDSVFNAFAEQAMDGFNKALISYGSAWTSVPTVSFSATEGASGFVFTQLHYWQFIIALGATIFAGIKITLDTESNRNIRELLKMFFLMIVTSSSGVAIVGVLVTVADLTAASIITAVSNDGKLDLTGLFKLNPVPGDSTASVSIVFLLIIAVGGLVTNLVQIGILLMRSAMMVLLTGFLPISASVSNTSWGRDWFNKNISWLIAFILYKPIAALIYGFGITLLGGEQNSTLDTITSMSLGIIVLLMSVFALPALIRFLTPAIAAIGAGSGGGMGLTYLASGMAGGRGGGEVPPSGATQSSAPPVSSPGGSSQNAAVSHSANPPTSSPSSGGAGASTAGNAAAGASTASSASGAASAGGAAATGGATIIAQKSIEIIGQVGNAVSGAAEEGTDMPGGAS